MYRILQKGDSHLVRRGFFADNKEMQSLTLFELVKQVVTSWQVIAITIAIILFLNIVFYVARGNRGSIKIQKLGPKKKPKAEKKTEVKELITSDDDDNLGLDEG